MSKLFKLKQWLTIEETAKHLSREWREPVSDADVLQLGLDDVLKLSVNFVNPVPAMCGEVVSVEGAVWEIIETDEGTVTELKSIDIGKERYVNFNDSEVKRVKGVYDLIVSHDALSDINKRFQLIVEGPKVKPDINHDGIFVELEGNAYRIHVDIEDIEFIAGTRAHTDKLKERINNGEIVGEEATKLLEQNKKDRKEILLMPCEEHFIFSAFELPEDDSILVVRTSAIDDFLNGQNKEAAPPKATL